jgi:hypothetical protein
MKTKYFILLLLSLNSCIKENIPIVKSEPLLGYWKSTETSFLINNLKGVPDPYAVTKYGDSLSVVLLPAVDYRYKIISVDKKNLQLSLQGQTIIFKRATSEWESN